jgi:hypothetical protein
MTSARKPRPSPARRRLISRLARQVARQVAAGVSVESALAQADAALGALATGGVLAQPAREASAYGTTCASCAKTKSRSARFLVPNSPPESFRVLDICSGCLREGLRIATAGRKRETSR